MKQNIFLCMRGTQYSPDSEAQTTEIACEGVLQQTAAGWLIAYEEPQPGAAPIKALLRVETKRVTLTRRGSVCSRMIFATGESHTAFYDFPAGRLTMDVVTDSLCIALPEQLELTYRLTVSGETMSEHRLTFSIKARET